MKPLTVDEAEIKLRTLSEDVAMLDDFDVSMSDYVRKRLREEPHNEWLWCIVEVTAVWKGVKGYASLGGCSYDSRQDFMLDEYYPQLVDDALKHLNERVEQHQRPCENCMSDTV